MKDANQNSYGRDHMFSATRSTRRTNKTDNYASSTQRNLDIGTFGSKYAVGYPRVTEEPDGGDDPSVEAREYLIGEMQNNDDVSLRNGDERSD